MKQRSRFAPLSSGPSSLLVLAAGRGGIAFLIALAIGCQSPTEPIYTEEVGFIAWNAEPFDVLVLPPSAAAGVDFTITVRSVGDGCSTPARTDVRYEGNVAIVTPYDNQVVWLPPNWGCPDILRTHVHVATLRFTTPGVAGACRGQAVPGSRARSGHRYADDRIEQST